MTTSPLAVLENLDIQYPEGASVIIRRMAMRLCENLVAVPDGDISWRPSGYVRLMVFPRRTWALANDLQILYNSTYFIGGDVIY